MTFSCLDRPGVSSMMKNDKFLMNCDRFVDIGRDRGTRWNTTEKLSDSDQNFVNSSTVFSSSPSTGGIKIGLTLKIEFSTHRKVMDKPLWGLAKLVTKFKFSFKKWPFVTPSVDFYVNFPKNHDFDDLDRPVMDILNLMCSNGPGWWIGAQGCLERGLESSRSILRSKLI